jgi:8-amino-7-oxononanoate synthase
MMQEHTREPIAITGIGCRFPGDVISPESFWDFLCRAGDGITRVPADRWCIDTLANGNGNNYPKRGGFLKGIDRFDPQFFGISPREARYMDPQQRLLLEITWEALEDGGIAPERITGSKTGVFVGLFMHDHENIHAGVTERSLYGPHSATGMSTTVAANRISYFFDFKGPSMVVDTACSSSLVAVHLACRSLWENETSLALAGGVNVQMKPEVMMILSGASMLSPDGYSKSFDARANGYARSEGAGMVVLKRLSAALADRDPIYAVIRGSAVNQDGRSDGLTVPNGAAQKEVLLRALSMAGVEPGQVDFVEAHGTGTAVGDPIEARSLGSVLSTGRSSEKPCIIGSVKSNIGHTESAAGVAGLIKVALMLKHQWIPQNLHFSTPHPDIPFDKLKLRVPVFPEPWPTNGNGGRKIAGVNAFGFGGTNAHVVVQQFEKPEISSDSPPEKPSEKSISLIPLSAKTMDALRDIAGQHVEMVNKYPAIRLADIGYTAALKKGHHPCRLTIAARSGEAYLDHLEGFLSGAKRPGLSVGSQQFQAPPRTAFIFSGMGQQWWAMGRMLLEKEPLFHRVVRECDALFQAHTRDWSLLEVLTADENISQINETRLAQPCIFAIQVALDALLRSWGIVPEAVAGHSVGEIAAAFSAGALSLEDAVTVCYHRSRLQQTTAGRGTMLAVDLSPEEMEKRGLLSDRNISIAAVNSPDSITLSGDAGALEKIAAVLGKENIFNRFLRVDVPYHGPHMDPILAELQTAIRGIAPRPETTPLVSTVTGRIIGGRDLHAAYWPRNVREPVCFRDAMGELVRLGCNLFVEIGSHPVLSASIFACLNDSGVRGSAIATLRRGHDEAVSLANTVGRLYCNGYSIDWEKLRFNTGGKWLRLPAYPWQRERHWIESDASLQMRTGSGVLSLRKNVEPGNNPLLGARTVSALPTWIATLDLEKDPQKLSYIKDHAVQGTVVFPGAGFVEMALAASRELHGNGICSLEDFAFNSALIFQGQSPQTVQFVLTSDEDFAIHSSVSDDNRQWIKHASGKMVRPAAETSFGILPLTEIKTRCPENISGEDCYEKFRELGLNYGPEFRNVETVFRGDSEAIARIHNPSASRTRNHGYQLDPSVLDACFQVLGTLSSRKGTFLPVEIKRIDIAVDPSKTAWAYARLVYQNTGSIKGDIFLLDYSGLVLAKIEGLKCRNIQELGTETIDELLYQYRWFSCPLGGFDHLSGEGLPSPGQIKTAVAAHMAEIVRGLSVDQYYGDIEPQLNRLCSLYIVQAMNRLGLRFDQWDGATTEHLARRLGISSEPSCFHQFHRLLRILDHQGILRCEDGEWGVNQVPEIKDPHHLWNLVLKAHPDCLGELMLIDRCGSKLVEVLLGEENPLELIFDPQSAVVEHFYMNARSFRVYNRIVQEAVSAVVKLLPKGRMLRILEIGAGTGALASYILPTIRGIKVSYTFTDISRAFTRSARKANRAYPWVTYRELDIEKPVEKQGFNLNTYDLILASDVIHATEDIKHSLENVKSLLTSNGLLMLLELTHPSLMFDLIFGMLKGWWAFSDHRLRPDHAVINAAKWKTVLGESGFSDIVSVDDRMDGQAPLQSLLIARGPRIEPIAESEKAAAPLLIESAGKRPWLILENSEGIGGRLAAALTEKGVFSTRLFKGDSFNPIDAGSIQIRPDVPEDMERILDNHCPDAASSPVIINLWETGSPGACVHLSSLKDDLAPACAGMSRLVKILNGREWDQKPLIRIITNGSQVVRDTEIPALSQTPIWGFGRVIITEHPDLDMGMIDLSPSPSESEIEALCEELLSHSPEDEVALRDNNRFVHRLLQTDGNDGIEAGNMPFRVEKAPAGSKRDFVFLENHPKPPEKGEVTLRIFATGLNFKDIARMSGLVENADGEPHSAIGLEASGIIVSVGEGVENFKPGDPVMGLVAAGLCDLVRTDAHGLVPKPASLTFEEAATVPVAFVTAYHALHQLARIARGETVLIHTGTGGVGLAAIQIARNAGAHVLATASTPEKRSFLKAMGIQYVGDSRSTDFTEWVRRETDGQMVDVLINTLSPRFLEANIAALKPVSGRLVDLVTIHNKGLLPMAALKKGVSIFAFDFETFKHANPEYLSWLLARVAERFEDGSCHPLPFRAYPVADISRAFGNMKAARHVGKQVLTMENKGVFPASTRHHLDLDSNGTYLITGGTSGFGLRVAQWLVSSGARHLALLSRSGINSDASRRIVDGLQAAGARVRVFQTDVTLRDQVQKVLMETGETMPPLKGIVHSAMVLDDGPVIEMDRNRIRRVLEPKILGAWHLHSLTSEIPLDFFICFSSFVSVVGNTHQGNYAAANAFLDALALYRRAQNLPALTLCWGVLGEAGYVSENSGIRNVLHRQGIKGLTLDQTRQVMAHGLNRNQSVVGAISIDWPTTSRFSHSVSTSPRFHDLLEAPGTDAPTAPSLTEGPLQPASDNHPDNPGENLEKRVLGLVSSVLGLAPDRLDLQSPLASLGFDSLMAVELSLAVEKTLEVTIPKMVYLAPNLTGAGLVEIIAKERPDLGASRSGVPKAIPDRELLSDEDREPVPAPSNGDKSPGHKPSTGYLFPDAYLRLKENFLKNQGTGPDSIYFNVSDGTNTNRTIIGGRELINFSSYNYLGMSGDPVVIDAAKRAIERYGTSVSASRIASGERPLHRDLEKEIALLVGAEDAVVFNSGFGTNESVVGHLCNSEDLVLYDSLIHASIQQGAKLSGAKVMPFPHNNHEALNHILEQRRSDYRHVLIAVEGVYSMDGDIPDLPRFVDIKKRHDALLMVDEAHSIGVLGKTGRGIGEYHGIDPSDVDLWMGTLSKTLASCGGYIAGTGEMVEFLKYTNPGFVYSVGATPPDTAAALAAIRLLKKTPDRVAKLQDNARFFLELAREHGFNTGNSRDSAVVPVILGQSKDCLSVYAYLNRHGILALPIMYPAVPENSGRLRFFLSSTHTREEIKESIEVIARAIENCVPS